MQPAGSLVGGGLKKVSDYSSCILKVLLRPLGYQALFSARSHETSLTLFLLLMSLFQQQAFKLFHLASDPSFTIKPPDQRWQKQVIACKLSESATEVLDGEGWYMPIRVDIIRVDVIWVDVMLLIRVDGFREESIDYRRACWLQLTVWNIYDMLITVKQCSIKSDDKSWQYQLRQHADNSASSPQS